MRSPESTPDRIRVRKSCRRRLWIRLQGYRNRYWLGGSRSIRLVRKLYSGQLFRCAGFPNDDQFQPEMEPMYDDKATESRITCGYRCPSFRALVFLLVSRKETRFSRCFCLLSEETISLLSSSRNNGRFGGGVVVYAAQCRTHWFRLVPFLRTVVRIHVPGC